MKELNAIADGKCFGFNGWGFQILLLTAQKSSGDESSVLFANEDEISEYFYQRDDFLANFSSW